MKKGIERINNIKLTIDNKAITDKSQFCKKSSKSLDKIDSSNNRYRNKNKLRQINNSLQNINYKNNNKNENARAKSKSDPDKRTKETLVFISKNKKLRSNRNERKGEQKINQQINNINKCNINNKNFITSNKDITKLKLNKINNKMKISSERETGNNIMFENLKYLKIDDISSLFNAWQNTSIIFKTFEEKLIKKNDFEIDKKSLKIKTKSFEAS